MIRKQVKAGQVLGLCRNPAEKMKGTLHWRCGEVIGPWMEFQGRIKWFPGLGLMVGCKRSQFVF